MRPLFLRAFSLLFFIPLTLALQTAEGAGPFSEEHDTFEEFISDLFFSEGQEGRGEGPSGLEERSVRGKQTGEVQGASESEQGPRPVSREQSREVSPVPDPPEKLF